MKRWLRKWLGIPSLAEIRKEFSEALLSKQASTPSPYHWTLPHNSKLESSEYSGQTLVPEGYPFKSHVKTDEEALEEFDKECDEKFNWGKWFLTEWDKELGREISMNEIRKAWKRNPNKGK